MEDEKPDGATPDLTTPDSYHADVVAKAVKFTVSLFLGRGKYETVEATSLEDAEALAGVMVDEHPAIKSKPIITAYDAEGNNVVVSGRQYVGGGRATATAPLDTPEAAALQEAADEAGWEAAAPPAPAAPAAKGKGKGKGPAAAKGKGKAPAKAKAPPAARKAPAKGKDKARRKEPAPRPAMPTPTPHGQRWTKEIKEQWDVRAARGELPPVPDFSAPTHANYRKRLEQLVAMAMAGDLAGLTRDELKPVSSSRAILCRYRDYAIKALMAKPQEKKRGGKPKEKTN